MHGSASPGCETLHSFLPCQFPVTSGGVPALQSVRPGAFEEGLCAVEGMSGDVAAMAGLLDVGAVFYTGGVLCFRDVGDVVGEDRVAAEGITGAVCAGEAFGGEVLEGGEDVLEGFVEECHAERAGVSGRGLGEYVVRIVVFYPVEGYGEVADECEAGVDASAAEGFGEVLEGDVNGVGDKTGGFETGSSFIGV